jgi:KipI family sensor histidine kinase inhibitor
VPQQGHAEQPGTPSGATPPALTWAGDRFLRVSFSESATDEAGDQIRAACTALSAACIPGLRDLTPAYTTVLLTFDALTLDSDSAERAVSAALANRTRATPVQAARLVDIPVCYGGAHGEDLAPLAAARGLTPDQVVALHIAAEYRVAFVGFTPGFPYLRGLPDTLATPRLPSPRPRVAAGSIGMAGTQTGIYPGGTPGGWRLIGRTPLRVFDVEREQASLLAMGDRVRFTAITPAEFDALAAQPAEGR